MIEIVNLSKGFKTEQGQHWVIQNASALFPRHVNMGILGLNGAGKSTLLKLISGELQPDSGRIIRKCRISWPLGFAGGFHGSLTGRENLRFVCRIYSADIAKTTAFVEDFAGLGQYMDNPVKMYSQGMRAKLAFGLSMAINFDCYLIDEITAVGDFTFRKKCEDIFRERRETSSLIVVSHNPQTIRKFCHQVIVIHGKKLIPFTNLEEGIKFYESSSSI